MKDKEVIKKAPCEVCEKECKVVVVRIMDNKEVKEFPTAICSSECFDKSKYKKK